MFLDTLGAGALALTLPGSAYLALLTAAAAAPQRRRAPSALPALPLVAPRIVVLVPAHNESTGLLRTLDSLRREVEPDLQARTVVVADNCSDDTAAIARAAGVQVLERHDADRRGKGHALQFGFDACDDADWFIVVDADTDVAPGFLAAMRRAMADGADALQCRYGVRDPLANQRATLADVALGGWNVLRPRGRAALGCSVGILGNGFALSRRTLQAVPYSARSIIEDVEYHQLLVQAGLRVRWVDDTQVRGDMPSGAAAAQQRARWEGGRLRLIADRAPALLRGVLRGALRGQWRLADPLFDLALLPLAWHVSLLLVALALGAGAVQALAAAGLVVVGLHVALALRLMRAQRAHGLALLGVPAYLAWKLCLAGATWRAADRRAAWVRSARRPS
jgi:cellulose synthase/poly-beta-1,6-N-acetylglucosamine synthase-like glycosyltransferase